MYWSNILQIALVIINVVYLLSIIMTLRSNEYEWTWSMLVWPVIYGWCEKTCYGMIIDELSRGLKPNYSLDIFAVVVLSHVASIFSDSLGGYVLYIIPLYALYKVSGYALAYLKSRSDTATTEQEEVNEDDADAKRKAKKERKEQRAQKMGGVKYAKSH